VSDLIMLGVHPSSPVRAGTCAPTGEPLLERVPAYVPRDVDEELRQRLAISGFVIVVGDSAAGKSRAASEAIATLRDHVLIIPQNRDSMAVAISKAAGTRRCVLWLDDLENYLGPGGLTRAGIARVLAGKRCHRVIVSTLRAAEEALLTSEDGREDGSWQSHKVVREVLEHAYRIPLSRMFSRSEEERARERAWDPRIADALASTGVYGLAEYLAAGPELMRDWENAWSPNTDPHAPSHPRGAALVTAAIEIRRGGYTSPLPRSVLEKVHDHYLRERGGALLRPEPLADAWEWATKARRATTALLQGVGIEHVHVFDYLLDAVQRHSGPGDHAPDIILEAALAVAAPVDADNIADAAFQHGRYKLAEAAWLRVHRARADRLGPEHADTLATRASHANALRNLGRYAEYECEHRAIADIAARVYGPEDPLTLRSRTGRAFALIRLRRPSEAEEELRAVRDIGSRVLGPEHDVTMTSRHLRAIALHHLGRLAEAEAENRSVLDAWTRDLGPEHASTLLSRESLAAVLYDSGLVEEAENEARAVLDMRTRTLGLEHPDTAYIRSLLTRIETI
jgi:tetratricopeptide (TPR) repeat protein